MLIWKGVSGQARVHGGGGGGQGGIVPHLEIGKKMLSGEILTSFTYVLLMKLGGGDQHTLHTCKMEGGGQTGACETYPIWEGVRTRGLAPSRNKKRLSEEILIYFTYILLMKVGGGIGIHAKWKGVGGQARVQGRGGEEALPPRNRNKRCCQFSLVSNEIRGFFSVAETKILI